MKSREKIETEPKAIVPATIVGIWQDRVEKSCDQVAAEEPMEVRVLVPQDVHLSRHSIAVTMRTPGHDFELAAGFLYTEGIVSERAQIGRISYSKAASEEARHNIVSVFLRPDVPFDPERFSRNVYTTSSCGICGKATLEMVRTTCSRKPVGDFRLRKEYFLGLPVELYREQTVFSKTGGIHASALFNLEGNLLLMREDVGRHNAMDKLIGSLLLEDRLPASDTVVLVSGRASYELIQKAVMAGIPALAAVGAPSSLAIDLARDFNMTLIGFLRDGRFNVYSGDHRLEL